MNSRTTPRFWKLFNELPTHVQDLARQAFGVFRVNPRHPGLHFKLVIDEPPTYSSRVGIGYRALGALNGDTIDC